MNICLLADTYPPDVGGLAVSGQRHAHSMAAVGHVVHVIVPDESLPPGERRSYDEERVTVHRLGTYPRLRETLAEWLNLALAIDAECHFAVFHGHFAVYAGYVAVLAARNRGVASVVGVRGNDVEVMPFDYRRAFFVGRALEWSDIVVAVSRDLARKASALAGRREVRVIHNGVDTVLFAPRHTDDELRASLELDDRPVLGFVGEARTKKGLGRLLRVFGRLCETTPAQLLLVGGVRDQDRPLVELFQAQHPDLPLRLVPPRPHGDLPRYYSLCDVVLLPSLWDGLPNALLEAMACGRPVLASAVGGMLDVITDGVDGLLLPRDDDAWVNALRRLLADADLRTRLGAAARRTVEARFTLLQERKAWTAVYEELSLRALHIPSATAAPPDPT